VLHAPLIAFQPYLFDAQYLVRIHHHIKNRWFEISNVWRERQNITYPWCCHFMQIPFLCKLFHDANDCSDYICPKTHVDWAGTKPMPPRWDARDSPLEQLHTLHLF
jgi:hypothetical protein